MKENQLQADINRQSMLISRSLKTFLIFVLPCFYCMANEDYDYNDNQQLNYVDEEDVWDWAFGKMDDPDYKRTKSDHLNGNDFWKWVMTEHGKEKDLLNYRFSSENDYQEDYAATTMGTALVNQHSEVEEQDSRYKDSEDVEVSTTVSLEQTVSEDQQYDSDEPEDIDNLQQFQAPRVEYDHSDEDVQSVTASLENRQITEFESQEDYEHSESKKLEQSGYDYEYEGEESGEDQEDYEATTIRAVLVKQHSEIEEQDSRYNYSEEVEASKAVSLEQTASENQQYESEEPEDIDNVQQFQAPRVEYDHSDEDVQSEFTEFESQEDYETSEPKEVEQSKTETARAHFLPQSDKHTYQPQVEDRKDYDSDSNEEKVMNLKKQPNIFGPSFIMLPNDQGFVQGKHMQTALTGRYYQAFLGLQYGTVKGRLGTLQVSLKPIVNNSKITVAINEPRGCPSLANLLKINYQRFNVNDCLTLSVFTPNVLGSLPVLIYIHGEMLFDGSSEKAWPEYLLENDVVLVVVKYRLASFGFNPVSENLALSDLELATIWVMDYIAPFGGDPKSISLFGGPGSAGLIYALDRSKKVQEKFRELLLSQDSLLYEYGEKNKFIF